MKSIISIIFTMVYVSISSFQAHAQIVDWKLISDNPGNFGVRKTKLAYNGNLLVFATMGQSLEFNGKKVTCNSGSGTCNVILEFTKDGKLTNAYSFPNNIVISLSDFCSSPDGGVILVGYFTSPTAFGNNIATSRFSFGSFLLKIDKSFQPQWANCFGDPAGIFDNFAHHSQVHADEKNIYFFLTYKGNLAAARGYLNINSARGQQNQPVTSTAILITNQQGAVGVTRQFNTNANNRIVILDGNKENLFFYINHSSLGSGSLIYNNNSFNIPSGESFISIAKSTLNIGDAFTNTGFTPTQLRTTSDGLPIVVGYFGKGFVSLSPFQFASNQERGLAFGKIKSGGFEWVNRTTSGDAIIYPAGISEYRGLTVTGTAYQGGVKVIDNDTFPFATADYKSFIGFFDDKGKLDKPFYPDNSIVLFSGLENGKGIFYIAGNFLNKFNLFNTDFEGNGYRSFVARIVFFELVLGNISKREYCAGDSLTIPYVLKGKVESDNFFIAELSDASGDVEKDWIEIGRIKDTTSGIIRARLPLKNVKTGTQYRIRIRSTNPDETNDYEADPLRITIYSKDSANAGEEIFFCPGDTLKLSTTGGSVWRWNPSTYFVNELDTVYQEAYIAPLQPIKYRIIIDDANNCGFRDTAYVNLKIRKPPLVDIEGPSSFCPGQKIKLEAKATGGDSNNYWYEWRSLGSSFVISRSKFMEIFPAGDNTFELTLGDRCTDTQFATKLVERKNSLQAKISGTKSCKGKPAELVANTIGCNEQESRYFWSELAKPDLILSNDKIFRPMPEKTLTYKLRIDASRTNLFATDTFKVEIDTAFIVKSTPDTFLCLGNSIFLNASVESCDTSNMEYLWTNNRNKDTIRSKSILVAISDETEYYVQVINRFNNLFGSAKTLVKILDKPLQIFMMNDTLICSGEQIKLKAKATGGYEKGYRFNWYDNKDLLLPGDSPTIEPRFASKYKLKFTDGCNQTIKEGEVIINTRDSLSIISNATDTTICFGQEIAYSLVGIGGFALQRNFNFSVNDTNWNFSSNKLRINPPKSTKFTINLNDQCSKPDATKEIFINVLDSLGSFILSPSKICSGDSAVFSALAFGGIGKYTYQWILPDKRTDTSISVKVRVALADTLKLQVFDGCSKPTSILSYAPTLVKPLDLKIIGKNEICEGDSVELKAIVSGGDSMSYQYNWNINGSSLSINSPNIKFKVNENSTLLINVTDGCALSNSTKFDINVFKRPNANFELLNKSFCIPFVLDAKDLSTQHSPKLNEWFISSISGNKSIILPLEINSKGEFKLTLKAKNASSCIDSFTKVFTSFLPTSANFLTKPNIMKAGEEVEFQIVDTSINEANWIINGTDKLNGLKVYYTFENSGSNSIELNTFDVNGCSSRLVSSVYVEPSASYHIPNSFRPNSLSHQNKIFKPTVADYQGFSITILNRWGEKVYDCSNSLDCGWDGTYLNEWAPEGVYSYQIVLHGFDGSMENILGTLLLIR